MLSIDDMLQNLSELRLCIINEEVGLGYNVFSWTVVSKVAMRHYTQEIDALITQFAYL